MSTPKCQNPDCKRNYWRYRSDFTFPRGYCSRSCFEKRRRRKTKLIPETAAAVLDAFREHRMTAHLTRDLNTWFDCEVCERFEERYAVSMYL